MSGLYERLILTPDAEAEMVREVRLSAQVDADIGPSDANLSTAIREFAEAFRYWYARVIAEAVPSYRALIVARINPFVRRFDCEGLSVFESVDRIVEDYRSRNFVTAGGWALEALALHIGPHNQKSPATGIDIQRLGIWCFSRSAIDADRRM